MAGNFFDDALLQPGASPRAQIKCYSLPYGGIGFATHILTYYTIIMLTTFHSPWRFKKLSHSSLDFWLAVIGLPFTIGPSVLTMIRCRSNWAFYALAAWKLSLSLMLAATTITTALKIRTEVHRGGGKWVYTDIHTGKVVKMAPEFEFSIVRTILGGMVYGAGTVAGFAGLVKLIIEAWSDTPLLRHLSYGAMGLFVFISFVGLIIGCCIGEHSPGSRFFTGVGASLCTALVVFAAGAAIYSDWALAAIADNLVGLPDGNNVLLSIIFWVYFAAKRLPMAAT